MLIRFLAWEIRMGTSNQGENKEVTCTGKGKDEWGHH